MNSKKTWLVTGASKGLGLEIVKAALAVEDNVIATVRKYTGNLSGISQQEFPNLLILEMDVTDEAAVNNAVITGLGHFGQIDVLVNNAGYGLVSAVEEASSAEVKSQFDTNVFGLLNVTRAVLPHMRKAKKGHVINISALFAFGTIAGWGIYSATKFAVEGISEGLALELAPLGIKVTVIEPGMFTTNFLAKGSFVESKNIISDYAETAGKIRNLTAEFNGKQPGNPKKLGEAVVRLVTVDNPPVHLPLGSDSVEFYKTNKNQRELEMDTWKELSYSTDHSPIA